MMASAWFPIAVPTSPPFVKTLAAATDKNGRLTGVHTHLTLHSHRSLTSAAYHAS